MYCYKGTNITGKRVVNHSRTQLIDALKESYVDVCFRTVKGKSQKGMFWVAANADWKRL